MQLRESDDLAARLHDALSLRCPNCGVFARMTLLAAPSWAVLQRERPARLGLILDCPACSLPVFLRSGPLVYHDDHIECEDAFQQVIAPRERFDLHLLPATIRDLVEEALGVYADGHFQAFALLANRIATLGAGELGPNGKLALFNAVTAAAQSAGIETPMLRLCRDILFELDAHDEVPALSAARAAVLLALLRDMLYQGFVRPGKLREAMRRNLQIVS